MNTITPTTGPQASALQIDAAQTALTNDETRLLSDFRASDSWGRRLTLRIAQVQRECAKVEKGPVGLRLATFNGAKVVAA
jgi:hypothetical protein